MANMYAKKKIMQEALETAIGNIYSKSLEQGFPGSLGGYRWLMFAHRETLGKHLRRNIYLSRTLEEDRADRSEGWKL
jgi:hypothetical protein